MEGRLEPGVANHLEKRWSTDARIEAADAIRSLFAQPGWVLLEQIVDEFEERGDSRLRDLADKTALACTPQQAIDYAQKRGVQNGLTFHRDVTKTILVSAERAADELKKRQREADAEGGS